VFGSAPFDPAKLRRHLQKQESAKAAAAQAALIPKTNDFPATTTTFSTESSMVTVISVNNEQAINQTINNSTAINATGNHNYTFRNQQQKPDLLWFERM